MAGIFERGICLNIQSDDFAQGDCYSVGEESKLFLPDPLYCSGAMRKIWILGGDNTRHADISLFPDRLVITSVLIKAKIAAHLSFGINGPVMDFQNARVFQSFRLPDNSTVANVGFFYDNAYGTYPFYQDTSEQPVYDWMSQPWLRFEQQLPEIYAYWRSDDSFAMSGAWNHSAAWVQTEHGVSQISPGAALNQVSELRSALQSPIGLDEAYRLTDLTTQIAFNYFLE